MNAIKSIYKNAPDSIPVPEEFKMKNIEVIFLPLEDDRKYGNISVFSVPCPISPTDHLREMHRKEIVSDEIPP